MSRLMLMVALACKGPPVQAPAAEDPGTETSGPEGCTTDAAAFEFVEETVGAVATLTTLAWETAEPSESHLYLRAEDGVATEIQPFESDGTLHRARTLGLLPTTRYEGVAVATPLAGGDSVCSDPKTIDLGNLPATLPEWPVLTHSQNLAQGYRLVPLMQQANVHIVVIDPLGRVVWAFLVNNAGAANDLVVFKAVPRLDGRGIWFNTQVPTLDGPSEIISVDWDGLPLETVEVPGGHTDFVQLPGGGIATLGWDARDAGDGRLILGDTILEVLPGGEIREVWNVWDHFLPDPDAEYTTGLLTDEPDAEDWSHVNSISYEASKDVYYITMTNFPAVIEVQRETGHMGWVLSGEQGDFETDDDRLIDLPHSAERHPDGVLVFNRRSAGNTDSCSDAIFIAVDEPARTAHEIWRYTGDRCAQVGFLGNAVRSNSGNTLVSWSHLGQLDEVDPSGQPIWQVQLQAGAGFGLVSWVDHLD